MDYSFILPKVGSITFNSVLLKAFAPYDLFPRANYTYPSPTVLIA